MFKAAILVGCVWGVISGLNEVKTSFQQVTDSHKAAIEQAINQ